MAAVECYLAEIGYYDPVGATTGTLYLGTHGFTTGPGDTPANQYFQPVLRAPSSLRRSLFGSGTMSGRSQVGIGDLVAVNNRGALDDALGYAYDGRETKVWRGLTTGTFPTDFEEVMVGTMAGPPVGGLEELRFSFRDRQEELRVPFQQNRYAGTGSLEGGDDLKGKWKPKVLGQVLEIPALLVNPAKHIYQFHDGALQSVDGVYDAGIALTRTVQAWTQETSGTANALFAVASDGGTTFVAVGASGTIVRSTNGGSTWSAATTPSFGSTDILCIAYSSALDLWVAGGASSKIAWSDDDGDTWTQITGGNNPFSSDSVQAIAASANEVIAVASTGIIGRSTDGNVFSSSTHSFGTINWQAAAYGDNTFVLGAATVGKNVIATSTDGTSSSWTGQDNTASIFPVTGLAYGRGTFVATGDGCMISEDRGATWTTTQEQFADLNGCTYAALLGAFLAVGDDASLPDVLISSAAGVTWRNNEAGFSGSEINAVAAGSADVVAVGAGGKIASADGPSTYASQADLLDDDLAPSPGTYKAYLAGGCIRLARPPEGVVTGDVTQGATAGDRTKAQLWTDVLTAAGLTSGDWSASDVTALDTATSAVHGFYSGTREWTCDQVADRLMAPGAWWGADREGTFRCARLTDPASGTSVASWDQNDIIRGTLRSVAPADDAAVPVWKTVLRYGRYWQTQENGVLAGVTDTRRSELAREWREEVDSDSAVQTVHPLARERTWESLIVAKAAAATEAARLQTLWEARRRRWEFQVVLDGSTAQRNLGEVVTLRYTDGRGVDRLGWGTGKKHVIIGLEHIPPSNDGGASRLRVEVWG